MRELYTKEQDVKIDIALGFVKGKIKKTTWRDMNGILIAGKAGSTKTNTAVWLANQLASQGVKLVRMDFMSDTTNPQTFLAQTEHLKYADILPPATELDEIQENISAIYELGRRRRKAGTWDNQHKYPVAVFIDEITTLLSQPVKNVKLQEVKKLGDGKKETTEIANKKMLGVMLEIIMQFRKDSIRFVVMGQDFKSSGNKSDVARFRAQFNTVLLHRLGANDVKLLEDAANKDLISAIGSLDKGQCFYNEKRITVPYIPECDLSEVAEKQVAKYPLIKLDDNHLLEHLLL